MLRCIVDRHIDPVIKCSDVFFGQRWQRLAPATPRVVPRAIIVPLTAALLLFATHCLPRTCVYHAVTGDIDLDSAAQVEAARPAEPSLRSLGISVRDFADFHADTKDPDTHVLLTIEEFFADAKKQVRGV